MSESHSLPAPGTEFASGPYLLDAPVAEAYLGAIDAPRRRRPANIHNDTEAARRAGYPAPIVAGEHSLAVLAQLLVDRFGMRFLRGGSFDVAFIKPAFFGDRLTAHARVTSVEGRRLLLDVWVENAAGERILVGSAAAAMESR